MCLSTIPWRTTLAVFFFLCVYAYGQDLAELAAREKARRDRSGGAKVRIRIESISVQSMEGTEEVPRKKNVSSKIAAKSVESPPKIESIRRQETDRWSYLLHHGPQLKQTIQAEQSRKERLEVDIEDARRRFPPVLRRGFPMEDSRIQTLVKERDKSQQRLMALRKEERDLEEEVRRHGWPPGLLRGQLP